MMRLTSHGAADGVTGSKHLIEFAGSRILLDCGLFQGLKLHRERNWQAIPFDVGSLDAVVLSHAHLDHSGFLPVLVKHGYRGPVYASTATRDLADVLLRDSAHLQEEDSRRANRYDSSKHGKALPLYTGADAVRALQRITPLAAGRSAQVGRVEVSLTPVGHLLGANAITLGRRPRAHRLFGRPRPPARPVAAAARAHRPRRRAADRSHLRQSPASARRCAGDPR